METITVWKWRKDPSKIILWNEQPFKGSETFAEEWDAIASFEALNPLSRPIPKGHALFLARRANTFPYNTEEVTRIENLFFPQKRGLYYIASIDHLSKEGISAHLRY